MSAFAKRLKNLRLAKGLSMKSLAARIGVPVTTYREWEYGRAINGEPYIKIATALDVSVHELLGGENKDLNRLHQAMDEAERALKKLKMELHSFF